MTLGSPKGGGTVQNRLLELFQKHFPAKLLGKYSTRITGKVLIQAFLGGD